MLQGSSQPRLGFLGGLGISPARISFLTSLPLWSRWLKIHLVLSCWEDEVDDDFVVSLSGMHNIFRNVPESPASSILPSVSVPMGHRHTCTYSSSWKWY